MNPQQTEFNTALANLTPKQKLKYTKANPNIGVGGVQQSFTGNSYQPISNLITTGDLTGNQNLIPVPPKPVSGTGYVPSVTQPTTTTDNNGLATYTPPAPAPATDTGKSVYKQQLDQISKDLGILDTKPIEATKIQEAQQLATKTEQATKDYNSYVLKKREIEKKLNEMQTAEANTVGGVGGGYSSKIQEYQRKSNAELADLAIQAQASQGLLDAARQTIKDTLDAQFSPIEDRIKLRAQFAQLASNDLTDSEKYKLDQLNKKDEANQKEVSTFATSLVNTVFENGAPVGVRTKIFQIAGDYASGNLTKEQAMAQMTTAAQAYGRNPIDEAYKKVQIEKLKAETTDKQSSNGAISRVSKVNANSPTYIQDVIQASAGGAKMTGDQINPISKALTVVGQIDTLQKNIENTNTGPILGIFRSNNPYDVKAQLIKGQLQSIIPNLARGVYGEVGVLTDNDIYNYSKTIGNLKSTKDLNNLLLSATLTTVKNSIADKLEVNAAAGRDVSGFINLYNKLDTRIKDINQRLGIDNGQSNVNPFQQSIESSIYNASTSMFNIPKQ